MEANLTTEQRVNQLVATKTGLKITDLRPQTRLFHDLGVAGDDASELLAELAAMFEIDMSEFLFNQFFPGEPHLLNLWKSPSNDPYLPLTVEDLYRSAEAKRFVYSHSSFDDGR